MPDAPSVTIAPLTDGPLSPMPRRPLEHGPPASVLVGSSHAGTDQQPDQAEDGERDLLAEARHRRHRDHQTPRRQQPAHPGPRPVHARGRRVGAGSHARRRLGHLVKGASQAETIRAVEAVAAGQAIFGPSVARRILEQAATPAADPPFPELTGRERAILDLLARGEDNSAIARSLGITLKTVRNHLSTTFAELQVPDRGRAVVRAREAGLGG